MFYAVLFALQEPRYIRTSLFTVIETFDNCNNLLCLGGLLAGCCVDVLGWLGWVGWIRVLGDASDRIREFCCDLGDLSYRIRGFSSFWVSVL